MGGGDHWGYGGGSGSNITGTFTIPTACGQCSGGYTSVTLIAAGGGAQGGMATDWIALGGGGYGHGGKAGPLPTATPPETSSMRPSASWQAGAGGGGSAILIGPSSATWMPAIVAGGGGGGGLGMFWENAGPGGTLVGETETGGGGGNAPGGNGVANKQTVNGLVFMLINLVE